MFWPQALLRHLSETPIKLSQLRILFDFLLSGKQWVETEQRELTGVKVQYGEYIFLHGKHDDSINVYECVLACYCMYAMLLLNIAVVCCSSVALEAVSVSGALYAFNWKYSTYLWVPSGFLLPPHKINATVKADTTPQSCYHCICWTKLFKQIRGYDIGKGWSKLTELV